jgi:hypothetical protein
MKFTQEHFDLLNEIVVQARDLFERLRATYDVGDLDEDIDESVEELGDKFDALDEFNEGECEEDDELV